MRRPVCVLALFYAVLVFVVVSLTDRAGSAAASDGFCLAGGERISVALRAEVREKEPRIRSVPGNSGKDESEEIVRLTLEHAVSADGRTPGRGMRIQCDLPAAQEPAIGDELYLRGTLMPFDEATNPGMFDAKRYYRILGVNYRLKNAEVIARDEGRRAVLDNALYALKMRGCAALRAALPEEQAGVMEAVLFGVRSFVPQDMRELYRAAGISHIIAISGLHVSFLGLGLFRLLRKAGMPLYPACIFSTAVLILYGRMTGFSPSAVRAVSMFALRMTAVILHRTYDMLTAAAASLLAMLTAHPLYILHTGFLFSYAAVFSLGYIAPSLPRLPGVKAWGASAAVTVGALPLYLTAYYTVPVYAAFLNLLVIPCLFAAMAGGALTVLCGMLAELFPVMQLAAAVPAFLTGQVLRYYEVLCDVCLSLPVSEICTGHVPAWKIALYLLAILAYCLCHEKIPGKEGKKNAARTVFLVCAVGFLVLHKEPGTRMVFLDVGQGDGILIAGERGTVLIDGGSSSVSGLWEYRLLPALKYCGVGRIDTWLITHSDLDHCSGLLQALESGTQRGKGPQIGRIVLPDIAPSLRDETYAGIKSRAEALKIPVLYASRGDRILAGKDAGTVLDVVHPRAGAAGADANENSLVCLVTCGDFTAFLTGDLEKDGERECLSFLAERAEKMPVDLLKVGHHGSASATGDDLLA
ncbi:MAG: ComEC/Rec2 family competence protein, partial [Lachnospiraceae bacterium]|nr:ComEC/Rec2 family competence protein [Lachnospiraceae bacterium]